jgi:hypothetical protein
MYLPLLIEEEIRSHEEALALLSRKPAPGPFVPLPPLITPLPRPDELDE